MLGEGLWGVGPRDRAGLRLDTVMGGGLFANGGSQHVYSFTIAPDLVLNLGTVSVQCTGVVATVTNIQVRVDSNLDIEGYLHLQRFLTAEASVNRDFSNVYITGNRRLVVSCLFSAVNAGNASNCSFGGLLLPRGNLAVSRLPSIITVT